MAIYPMVIMLNIGTLGQIRLFFFFFFANGADPDQRLLVEQSDLVPHCLQFLQDNLLSCKILGWFQ